eukprot:2933597-Rhodomonas_salina.2
MQCPVPSQRTMLRLCYAISSTDAGYGASRLSVLECLAAELGSRAPYRPMRMVLCIEFYATLRTDLAYGATRCLVPT